MFLPSTLFSGGNPLKPPPLPPPPLQPPFFSIPPPCFSGFLSNSRWFGPSPPIRCRVASIELQPEVEEPKNCEHEGSVAAEGESGRVLDEREEAIEGPEERGISGIQVPRQRYIAVSKSELRDAIVSIMFDSQEEKDHFLQVSSCLDSILHAEHKRVLEEMRDDYDLTCSMECKHSINDGSSNLTEEYMPIGKDFDAILNNSTKNGSVEKYREDEIETENLMSFDFLPDWRSFTGSSSKEFKKNDPKRVAMLSRFQRAFVQLLYNAEFEELSSGDLMLTSALNTDYLLTLPINVDWKKASQSRAIIYRRGYTSERQKGLLIVEKLDYLQSKLLQRVILLIVKPLGQISRWITELLGSTEEEHELQHWAERIKLWLKELPLLQWSYTDATLSDTLMGVEQLSDSDLPIWLAAQRATSRYEGILTSVGPRGRLFRKFLTWIGLLPPIPEQTLELHSGDLCPKPPMRPIFLPRISLSDIWKPASRKNCRNDFWKMFKTAISILLSRSILEEPAFKELILLYTEEIGEGYLEDTMEFLSLQLKIYEKIPIPDLPVIFPYKKLSFRILDSVRLDIATILGLLAFFINYKFEDILSSPSAVILDVIAVSALVIYGTRVVLGYKQTWDRYQLLVNRTLNEKTLASGFGSVHFLLDASEQQQYKEAILAYAMLLKEEGGQVAAGAGCFRQKCEKFFDKNLKEKIEMPVDKAMNTLVRLGLVKENFIDGNIMLEAIPCSRAYEILKQRWHTLLG